MRTCHATMHIWWRSVLSFIRILFCLFPLCGLLSLGFGADGKGSGKIRLRWLRLRSTQVFLSWSEPHAIQQYGHQRSGHSLKLSSVWSVYMAFGNWNAVNSVLTNGSVGEGGYCCYSVSGIDRGFNLYLLAAVAYFSPNSVQTDFVSKIFCSVAFDQHCTLPRNDPGSGYQSGSNYSNITGLVILEAWAQRRVLYLYQRA